MQLLPSYEAAFQREARVKPEAHEEYLKDRYYWNQRTLGPYQQLSRAIERFQRAIEHQPDYAMIHLGRDDIDAFYMWVDKAMESRSAEVLWIAVDPVFDPLRRDPRFEGILRKLWVQSR